MPACVKVRNSAWLHQCLGVKLSVKCKAKAVLLPRHTAQFQMKLFRWCIVCKFWSDALGSRKCPLPVQSAFLTTPLPSDLAVLAGHLVGSLPNSKRVMLHCYTFCKARVAEQRSITGNGGRMGLWTPKMRCRRVLQPSVTFGHELWHVCGLLMLAWCASCKSYIQARIAA